jgi:predicted RNA-binding protein with PUA-like domain
MRFMVNYWMFTVIDGKEGTKTMKGMDIYMQRMSDGFFGIRTGVRNYRSIRQGDRVVYYLAGKKGQRFVGTATITSDHYELSAEERKILTRKPFFWSDIRSKTR